MKNNSKQTPNVTQDIIAKANLQSRDLASGQPLLKLNVGQGNSFIVKNSNIVITQNTINKAIVNPSFP
jgi:hypothetical protein